MRIEARGLSLSLGSRSVLSGLDFLALPGEMTAVIGPNGAGKTTLIRVLCGLLAPAAGTVLVDGRPMAEWSQRQRARALAYLPQERLVHWALTARRVVALGDGWHADRRVPEEFAEVLGRLRAAADAAGRDMKTLAISSRFSLTEDLLAKGPQAAIDILGRLKQHGLQHVLLEFRRPEHQRMFEILDLVTTTIRPAVDAA